MVWGVDDVARSNAKTWMLTHQTLCLLKTSSWWAIAHQDLQQNGVMVASTRAQTKTMRPWGCGAVWHPNISFWTVILKDSIWNQFTFEVSDFSHIKRNACTCNLEMNICVWYFCSLVLHFLMTSIRVTIIWNFTVQLGFNSWFYGSWQQEILLLKSSIVQFFSLCLGCVFLKKSLGFWRCFNLYLNCFRFLK